jgi:multiple sugar transport system substrate-binding protein
MITLRGMTWDHPRGFDSVVGAAEEYRGTHPDIRVAWSARSLQHFADQTLAELAQEYDLLVIDHPHVPEAHEQGILLALDGRGHDEALAGLAGQTIGASHASYYHGGHCYGLAIDAAAQVSVHRPDLLAQPPLDWDGVDALARAGKVLWPAKPVDAISSLITLAANFGHPMAERPGELLDRPTGLAVMDRLHRLARSVPAWCLEANPIEVAEALSSTDEWSYCPLAFGYTNYSRMGYRAHRLAYRDIPAGPGGVSGSCLGGAGIAVSASTPHPAEAVEHAFWLARPEVQAGVYYRSGGQPGYASAWDDDAVNADSLDFFRGTRATLDASYLRPRYSGWLEVFDRVGTLVNEALRSGGNDDEAMLDAAQACYERSLSAGRSSSVWAQAERNLS